LVGNSDGIGLALTRELLRRGWKVWGLSRSASPIDGDAYRHLTVAVQDEEYCGRLKSALEEMPSIDLCVYCAGIGELLNTADMSPEIEIVKVNFLGLLKTLSLVIPVMVAQGKGHVIGLSSVADAMLSPEAPGYHASKAAFSNYLEGLALHLKGKGVHITNVRFGFVETKMAKGDVRPFMMSAERAVQHLLACMRKRPVRYTAPKIVIPLVKFRDWMLRLSFRGKVA
jgi:short-subunit dehydrogenase